MLKEALKARLPLIVCTTTDVYYAEKVITHLSGAASVLIVKDDHEPPNKFMLSKHTYTITIGGAGMDWAAYLKANTENDKTLVVVNPIEPIPIAFDAGEIPVPRLLMLKMLKDFLSPKEAKFLLASFNGLTLRQTEDICKLSQSIYQNITQAAVAKLRGQVTTSVPGVQLIPTSLPHYEEEDAVEAWVNRTGAFLLMDDIDTRLRPRGLLMAGEPGTGKTLSAKYIARTLAIPLYRLDVGALQSKYVGESEFNMRRALNVITSNDPCVMLIDEVEKLFFGTDDSGVTKNLLAGLLWWLQEHESRVLTVMTTNNKKALPDELIRPGRIDRMFHFGGVSDPEAYIEGLVDSLGIEGFEIKDWIMPASAVAKGAPQSGITKLVLEQARTYLIEKS